MANILLIGLSPETVAAFTYKLLPLNHRIESVPYTSNQSEFWAVDLIIASSDDFRWRSLLKQVRSRQPNFPFVLVSSLADDSKWIEALEAGATDYCPSDIDSAQLRWIIQNSVPTRALVSVNAA
jgi:DNA-binding NarL/FixJ family response regulator